VSLRPQLIRAAKAAPGGHSRELSVMVNARQWTPDPALEARHRLTEYDLGADLLKTATIGFVRQTRQGDRKNLRSLPSPLRDDLQRAALWQPLGANVFRECDPELARIARSIPLLTQDREPTASKQHRRPGYTRGPDTERPFEMIR
jgi:hypothetical protein